MPNNYYNTDRNTQEELLKDTKTGEFMPDRVKSFWSVIFMALFVLFLILAFATGWLTISVTFLLISLGCFVVAGFPWGVSILWPFWRDHLAGARFNVIWLGGILFIISLIIDIALFVAKWVVLIGLCIVIGWISMFVHTGTIIRNLKSTGAYQQFSERKNITTDDKDNTDSSV